MDYYDAKNKINNIKDATGDYQQSINKVQSELLNKLESLNNINKSISKDINQKDIVGLSSEAVNAIKGNINTALQLSANALSALSEDATEEIKKIVNNYNSSIDPENPTPTLEYEEISFASVAGIGDFSDDGGSSRGGGGGGYTPPKTFEEYISSLGTENINSKDIDNWDNIVSDFLNQYGLTDTIESIKIEGNKIIIKYKNGKEETIENVKNIEELVSKIKSNIE